MSIIAPPPPATTERPSDPEALIEETRRHTRRRRRRNGAVAAFLLGIAVVGIAAHGRGGAPAPGTSTERPSGFHVAGASQLMHNGPLTVIKQSQGHGGVYTVGRAGLGGLLLRCHGAHAACLELEYIAWSPDGSKIALGVTSYGTPSSYDGLHVVDVKTGHDVQLTGGRADQAGLWTDPAWSPDGKWLAYGADSPGEVALARADGSQHRTLVTGYPGWIRYPTWSPDGTRVAFQTDPREGCGRTPFQVAACAIYVVRTDGTQLRRLAGRAASPAWSPLGSTIAYQARCGIRLVTPSGSDATPRSRAGCRHIGVRGQPVWSPDGRKIAVAYATTDASRGLYVMNADGSHLRHLTRAAGRGDTGIARPAWEPRS
jgi:dipeptidyl aminopeptidase/acylaminoacyl peptidase